MDRRLFKSAAHLSLAMARTADEILRREIPQSRRFRLLAAEIRTGILRVARSRPGRPNRLDRREELCRPTPPQRHAPGRFRAVLRKRHHKGSRGHRGSNAPCWVAVELKAVAPLRSPVTLQAIKGEPSLEKMALLRISRLSVQPVAREEFDRIVALGK
jgi:hypothetical protein